VPVEPAAPEMVPEPTELIWPNPESYTNSDPWLVENHDRITRLERRVLVINFDASETLEVARAFAERVAAAFAEGSRYHGYEDAAAPVFLDYQLVDVIDLPNEETRQGNGFGFAEFMHSAEFAQKVGSHTRSRVRSSAYNQDPAYRDCGGGWSIYMRQNFPGFANPARDVDGQPMKNWWPFSYY
jgi:hypothetical protein